VEEAAVSGGAQPELVRLVVVEETMAEVKLVQLEHPLKEIMVGMVLLM
jgi:hypothetical protein